MHNVAILVGAGNSIRMQKRDKTFLSLAGKPVLIYSIQAFERAQSVDEIILVVKEERIKRTKEMIKKYDFKKVRKIIGGGETRQQSVYNGIQSIEKADIVLIHDIARPFIDENLIEECSKNAIKYGAAIPLIPVTDTIKRVKDDHIKETIERKELFLAQTPQTFRYEIIKAAHEYAKRKGLKATDDASLVERIGYKIKTIKGRRKNIKLTFAEDIVIAEALAKALKEGKGL